MLLSITAIIAAVAFPLYLVFRKDAVSLPTPLTCALVLSAILELFNLLVVNNPEHFYDMMKFSLITEAVMIPVWLWFALTHARPSELHTLSISLRITLATSPLIVVATLILPIRSFIYSPDFVSEKILFLSTNGFIFYLLILFYLVTALIKLEQTLVQSTWTSRWKIKYELLGAGAFLTLLVIYYSQGLLFRTINLDLAPMRSFVLIVAIAMMFYSRLKRDSGVTTVHVSQQIACKSAVLLAVGVYIGFLGVVGEGMKYFGNGFHHSLIFALVFLTGLALLTILLSETVKRRVTIFIHKNFYQNKYDYRTQWLQFTDRLSASQTSDNLLHSIISEFCDTFGMGSGTLFIINQERDTYRLATSVGMENISTVCFGMNDPAVEYFAVNKWIYDVRENIAVANNLHREFFSSSGACFIVPLFMSDLVDGFIILGRPHSSKEIYTHEDFDLMRTLGKQASSALQNLRLSDQLACSRELAAIGKVSTFVMHDLKNLVSAVSLLLENAQEHITVPAFQNDLLMSLGNTVIKMRAIISRLKHLPEKHSLQMSPVNLLAMVQDTAAMVTGRTLEVIGTTVIAEADREELQKVTLNLMLNAVEATEGNSPVTVEVGVHGSPFIRVKDKGCGIPAAFIQHVLFKPFTSTKKQGMGIGLYQSRQIIEAHGGRIEVESSIDNGSEFTVWLPKMQPIVV